MSADTQSTAQAAAQDGERFVEIPRAKPGQEYKAPRNFQQPLVDLIYRVAVTLLCLSLPIAPGVIFFMMLTYSKAIEYGLLWVWITMIVIIEAIAIPLAWGIAREALGISGVTYIRKGK